jgi:adenine-specific DNA-methyltransferase
MSQNFEKLKSLITELFQSDHADLNFGIYRIMNVRNNEIERFLINDLLPYVRDVLSDYARKSLSALEEDLKDVAENEVFNHVYNFFSRYYSNGEFISHRRYKDGVYVIPYDGEDVKLYWSNYDQYYIKTSEYFRDYTFKLPNGKRVHFKLVKVGTEKDNNCPQNGKECRFILSEGQYEKQDEKQEEKKPLVVENGELIIRFEYRPDPKKRKQSDLNAEAADHILNKIKELKEQPPENIKEQQPEKLKEWQRELDSLWQELSSVSPTEKNPNRTLLKKHLTSYTVCNTFDYFIHKDIGGFLRRELDIYIKNDVLNIDDIESETAVRVEQYMAKVKAIRLIAYKIIDFLSHLENFQKKLWLKKKFVVETQYCVTLDRIFAIKDEETRSWLLDQILKSDAQHEEWVRLFAIDEIQGDHRKPSYSVPLKTEFIESNPYLVLDTCYFSKDFKHRLINSFDDIDENCDGLLIHSENFQALNLLMDRYKRQVKCIYIDPPYNTGTDKFVYKDEYQTSSWLSFLRDRIMLAHELLAEEAIFFSSIDDNEEARLHILLEYIFGASNVLPTVVVRRRKSQPNLRKGVAPVHDYLKIACKNYVAMPRLSYVPKEFKIGRFSNPDNDPHGPWTTGPCSNRGGSRYKIVTPVGIEYEDEWRFTKETYKKLLEEGRIYFPESGHGKPRYKIYLSEKKKQGVVPSTWWDDVGDTQSSHKLMEELFGQRHFENPKPLELLKRIVDMNTLANNVEYVLDFFAGSGTTAHAVINLNRDDDGRRKYILVEMGDYFDTVLVPRIKKVVYSKDWKDGKPVSRKGISHMFKVLRLESYDDTLNNLELNHTKVQQPFLEQHPDFRDNYMLHYMLDVKSRENPSLLDIDYFEDPFNYKLDIATGTAGKTKPTEVDIVETFNYLIGIRVKTIRYLDNMCVVTGTNHQGERILILWRNTKEINNDKLDDWFKEQGYNDKDKEFDVIYVNGDNNLENLKEPNHTWKIRLIEEEFLQRMFNVQDV